MYKVIETIHMLWMSRWIHNHATTTILVGAEFRELDDFLDHSKTIHMLWIGRWKTGVLLSPIIVMLLLLCQC